MTRLFDICFFFFSSRRRHTRSLCDWSSDVCSSDLWLEQAGQEREYYDQVRDRFNESNEPHHFLYLLARCVKAAVRYNGEGKFNNSPDNRRLGMRPATRSEERRVGKECRARWTRVE